MWKESPDRLPLIVRGARQVGKTYAIEAFGKSHFAQCLTINFELEPRYKSCFATLDPTKIVDQIEVLARATIHPGKTLLFFDEIQECPEAIQSLRYFKERMPELHVISAGSLLEFTLNDSNFSFPVGRVAFLYQKPWSFAEFLHAMGEDRSLKKLAIGTLSHPLPESMHHHLLDHLRTYFVVGGMPGIAAAYISKRSLGALAPLQSGLLQTYRTDFGKYASKTEHRHLQTLFEKAPFSVGSRFKYAKIDPETRSREVKIALQYLTWAGVLAPIYASSGSGLPLAAQKKENQFKILHLDIGLLQNALHVNPIEYVEGDLVQINAGALAEQFVGQELQAYAPMYEPAQLYFWHREKETSSAEVDFLWTWKGKIFPIEVKAGATGRLKSLRQFLVEKKSPFGIRISQHPLSFIDGVLSVPLYMIEQLPRLVGEQLLESR